MSNERTPYAPSDTPDEDGCRYDVPVNPDPLYVDGINPWSGLPDGQPHDEPTERERVNASVRQAFFDAQQARLVRSATRKLTGREYAALRRGIAAEVRAVTLREVHRLMESLDGPESWATEHIADLIDREESEAVTPQAQRGH